MKNKSLFSCVIRKHDVILSLINDLLKSIGVQDGENGRRNYQPTQNGFDRGCRVTF